MGMMIIPNNNTLHLNTGEQPSFIHKGYFTNLNAASNLIHYITRTRAYESRYSDLKGWGAYGAPTYSGVEPVIQCFLSVQKCHRGDNVVRKMYHFVYQPDDTYERPAIGLNYDLLQIIACEQSRYFYTLGHQIVYAVHDEPDPQKRLHIHFAVNSVNYITGMMLHFCKNDLESLTYIMNWISASTIYANTGLAYPIISYANIHDKKDVSVATNPILHTAVFHADDKSYLDPQTSLHDLCGRGE